MIFMGFQPHPKLSQLSHLLPIGGTDITANNRLITARATGYSAKYLTVVSSVP
jgi:hypothetical protein